MFTKQKRKEMVRTAAMAAAGGFLVIAAFEVALVLGAPLGRAAMGGFYEQQLPMGLRIVSGVAVGVWLLFVLIVLGRAGFKVIPLPAAILRWGTWVLVGLMFEKSNHSPRLLKNPGSMLRSLRGQQTAA